MSTQDVFGLSIQKGLCWPAFSPCSSAVGPGMSTVSSWLVFSWALPTQLWYNHFLPEAAV